jgi:hypothetical protein
MTEGYFITKASKLEVENKLKIKIMYDEEMSKILQINIFWIPEGKIDKETQDQLHGRFFSLDEVMFAGLKDCTNNVAMNIYFDKKSAM